VVKVTSFDRNECEHGAVAPGEEPDRVPRPSRRWSRASCVDEKHQTGVMDAAARKSK